jgi:hypothetical protein
MINVDRQFNPDSLRILRGSPDFEEERQDENVVIVNQVIPTREWPGLDNSINFPTTTRLDGIVLCSNDPNIIFNRK